MLSNGISSRLQQLQSVKEGKACHDAATSVSVEHGSGLAANLIKKFNQMSAAGHGHLATADRSLTPATKHQPSKSTRQPLRLSSASEYDCDCHAAASETTDDDDSVSCTSAVSDGSKGTSPFLSDSELDRALFEIREFSRNMNISLLDDEM
ncbi:hypothetical protein GGI20_003142 [Coemansia sp. BCRC 34301]|nr:hypothetical protein GGI20_003142 [Coemansia sp. BCRC 34301]